MAAEVLIGSQRQPPVLLSDLLQAEREELEKTLPLSVRKSRRWSVGLDAAQRSALLSADDCATRLSLALDVNRAQSHYKNATAEALMLHRARSLHPTVGHQHGTAVEMNQWQRTRRTDCFGEGHAQVVGAEPPPFVSHVTRRALGTAAFDVARVRQGFSNGFQEMYERGGRRSSVSIPSREAVRKPFEGGPRTMPPSSMLDAHGVRDGGRAASAGEGELLVRSVRREADHAQSAHADRCGAHTPSGMADGQQPASCQKSSPPHDAASRSRPSSAPAAKRLPHRRLSNSFSALQLRQSLEPQLAARQERSASRPPLASEDGTRLVDMPACWQSMFLPPELQSDVVQAAISIQPCKQPPPPAAEHGAPATLRASPARSPARGRPSSAPPPLSRRAAGSAPREHAAAASSTHQSARIDETQVTEQWGKSDASAPASAAPPDEDKPAPRVADRSPEVGHDESGKAIDECADVEAAASQATGTVVSAVAIEDAVLAAVSTRNMADHDVATAFLFAVQGVPICQDSDRPTAGRKINASASSLAHSSSQQRCRAAPTRSQPSIRSIASAPKLIFTPEGVSAPEPLHASSPAATAAMRSVRGSGASLARSASSTALKPRLISRLTSSRPQSAEKHGGGLRRKVKVELLGSTTRGFIGEGATRVLTPPRGELMVEIGGILPHHSRAVAPPHQLDVGMFGMGSRTGPRALGGLGC
ncbi:hypothetical protein AB1Y20_010141 [Prymnesium parvum]|uniref:Uncharacterized protein n=1 Tax=Prymnesium parvum TaxID=97485 RepID=A0AB34K6C1_PRYPA